VQQAVDNDMVHQVPTTQLRVELGDAVELTLGEGAGTSEDKRYQYN
jgi:hypothetical protein